jgi:hypothetical protein
MRRLLMLIALATTTAAIGAGCAGDGTVRYTATATYSQPSLAYVSPGVYVVEDYDQPVFYSNNVYWRYNNGLWYQSRYHDRGFVYYSRPPRAVVSIQRPYAYVRYRGSVRYNAGRDTRQAPGGVRVRDHRYYR